MQFSFIFKTPIFEEGLTSFAGVEKSAYFKPPRQINEHYIEIMAVNNRINTFFIYLKRNYPYLKCIKSKISFIQLFLSNEFNANQMLRNSGFILNISKACINDESWAVRLILTGCFLWPCTKSNLRFVNTHMLTYLSCNLKSPGIETRLYAPRAKSYRSHLQRKYPNKEFKSDRYFIIRVSSLFRSNQKGHVYIYIYI